MLETVSAGALGFEGLNGDFDVSVGKTKASHISHVLS
jgi:hypothetical protein